MELKHIYLKNINDFFIFLEDMLIERKTYLIKKSLINYWNLINNFNPTTTVCPKCNGSFRTKFCNMARATLI